MTLVPFDLYTQHPPSFFFKTVLDTLTQASGLSILQLIGLTENPLAQVEE